MSHEATSVLIRVTSHDGLDVPKLLQVMKSDDVKVFGVYECPHDNPHWHFYLMASIKYDAIRKRLMKVPGMVGKYFSIKSGDGNLKYLCKGPGAVSKLKEPDYPGTKEPPDVVVNTMDVSADEVTELHEAWWAEAEEWVRKKRDKKSGEEGRSCMQLCYDAMREDPQVRVMGVPPARRDVIRWMVQYHLDHKKGIDVYTIRRWANTVMCWLNGDFVDDLVNEIDSKL